MTMFLCDYNEPTQDTLNIALLHTLLLPKYGNWKAFVQAQEDGFYNWLGRYMEVEIINILITTINQMNNYMKGLVHF